SRLATLAHAVSSTSATAPKRTSTVRRVAASGPDSGPGTSVTAQPLGSGGSRAGSIRRQILLQPHDCVGDAFTRACGGVRVEREPDLFVERREMEPIRHDARNR